MLKIRIRRTWIDRLQTVIFLSILIAMQLLVFFVTITELDSAWLGIVVGFLYYPALILGVLIGDFIVEPVLEKIRKTISRLIDFKVTAKEDRE